MTKKGKNIMNKNKIQLINDKLTSVSLELDAVHNEISNVLNTIITETYGNNFAESTSSGELYKLAVIPSKGTVYIDSKFPLKYEICGYKRTNDGGVSKSHRFASTIMKLTYKNLSLQDYIDAVLNEFNATEIVVPE